MELSDRMHQRVQALVAEYAGALSPGRVIATAVGTAALLRRREPFPDGVDDSLEHWEGSTRRRLSEQVAGDLARVHRSRPVHRTSAA